MLKQNILALIKPNLQKTDLILFNDPSDEYNFSVDEKFSKLFSINECNLTVNDINIINFFIKNGKISDLIINLIKYYFSLEINNPSILKNIIVQKEHLKEKQVEKEKQIDKEFQQNIYVTKRKIKFIIRCYHDLSSLITMNNGELSFKDVERNGIIFLCEKLSYILYNHEKNIICILNELELNLFMMNNNICDIKNNYTLIILYLNKNYKYYGRDIDYNKIIKIMVIVKIIFKKISNQNYIFFTKDEEKYIQEHDLIKIIKSEYPNIFSEYYEINIDTKQDFLKKYLKYKKKYLLLKNI